MPSWFKFLLEVNPIVNNYMQHSHFLSRWVRKSIQCWCQDNT